MSQTIICEGAGAAEARGTVYVVDDDGRTRMTLVGMLQQLGYAPWPLLSGIDLMEAVDELSPGCILLDVRMPEMSGTDVLQRLSERGCDWPVIMVTGNADVPLAVQAMKLGAIEFIEKPCRREVLGEAVDRGLGKLADAQAQRRSREDAAARLEALTARERSVLNGLVAGSQNKTVAHRLGLSVRTVEMHRANLLRKLGLRAVQEAGQLIARANAASLGPLPG